MLKTAISVAAPGQRHLALRGLAKWPVATPVAMAGAFLVASVMAAIMLAIFGVADRGTEIALRATARWSFLLFWLAYIGSAMANLFGSRFDRLAQHGRQLGLAFASAQVIHVGLVLWLLYLPAGPGGAMLLFWAGIACTYLLALFSWPRIRDALGPRLWQIFRAAAMEYIAFVFALDFILLQLQKHGATAYPLSYVPFAVMLVGGFCLRLIALARWVLMAGLKPAMSRDLQGRQKVRGNALR
jgi:hypothetical protein